MGRYGAGAMNAISNSEAQLARGADLSAPPHHVRHPWLVVDVQHGLCNRLRALASAAVIAQASGHRLVVAWQRDAHCEAGAADLLHLPWPVIEDPSEVALFRARAGRVWNYMEIEDGAAFNEPVTPGDLAGRNAYLRSAYVLAGPLADHDAETQVLRDLRPVAAVRDMVRSLPGPFDVALHVRMGTGPAFDHLAYEGPQNWPADRHAELTEWRQKSDVARFVAVLDRMVAAGEAGRIFAAADLPATYAVLAERYGARLHFLARDLYDRSPRQLQYALADLILLTRAPVFLASHFSSFSDVAQRLARPGRRMLSSGLDF